MSTQEEVTISLKHFFHYFSTLLILLFTHQSPQALTCFYLCHNWEQQNRVVSEGMKRAWLLSFCSFRESVSLLGSQGYKRQPVTGLRGDILSSSRVCIQWNNPFLYGLVLPALRCGPIQLSFQLDYCTGLWSQATHSNLKCSLLSAFTPLFHPSFIHPFHKLQSWKETVRALQTSQFQLNWLLWAWSKNIGLLPKYMYVTTCLKAALISLPAHALAMHNVSLIVSHTARLRLQNRGAPVSTSFSPTSLFLRPSLPLWPLVTLITTVRKREEPLLAQQQAAREGMETYTLSQRTTQERPLLSTSPRVLARLPSLVRLMECLNWDKRRGAAFAAWLE